MGDSSSIEDHTDSDIYIRQRPLDELQGKTDAGRLATNIVRDGPRNRSTKKMSKTDIELIIHAVARPINTRCS